MSQEGCAEALERAAITWHTLYAKFDSQTISLAELEKFKSFLSSDELRRLYCSGECIVQGEQGEQGKDGEDGCAFSWGVRESDDAWIERRTKAVQMFNELIRVYTNLDEIIRYVRFLEVYMAEDNKKALDTLFSYCVELRSKFTHNWDSCELLQIKDYVASFRQLDDRLLRLNGRFLEALR